MSTTEPILPPFFQQHFENLQSQLEEICMEEPQLPIRAKKSFLAAQERLPEIRAHIATHSFASPAEEIVFFKEIKPLFLKPLIYHRDIFTIERNRPIGSLAIQQDFLHYELQKIKMFFDDNRAFYHYFRSGSTALDTLYYTRGHIGDIEDIDPLLLQLDTQFSTGYDYILAKLQANDMISDYLNRSLYQLMQPKLLDIEIATSPLKWTGSVIDLAEQIYGWLAHGSINNGKISASTLARTLSYVFNIKIDYIAKKKEEIRMRKKNRTVYFDAIKRSLIRKMEEDDEHAL